MHDSAVLRDNPLGDPHQRKLSVYLPAAYDSPRNAHRRFITLYDLAGFTSSGLSHLNWRNFDENLPEKLDRLIRTKRMPPVIVVFPDCFTRLGGNQYINSSAIGDYADYLNQELVPFVDDEFRTLAMPATGGASANHPVALVPCAWVWPTRTFGARLPITRAMPISILSTVPSGLRY
jgi:enterochelin esterase-like enzyme